MSEQKTILIGEREIPASKAAIEKAIAQCRSLIEKGFQVEHYTVMLTEYQTALRTLKKHRQDDDTADNHPDQRPSRVIARNRSVNVRNRRVSYYKWQERLGLDPSMDVSHDDEYYVMSKEERPRTRADCWNSGRPCPFIGCKYNLWMDVHTRGKSKNYKPLLKPNRPDKAPWEMPPGQSCALDIADVGGMTLEDVGDLITLTRERIRQVENIALAKMLEVLEPDLDFDDLVPLDNGTNWDILQNETH